jgi:hypothetical protein
MSFDANCSAIKIDYVIGLKKTRTTTKIIKLERIQNGVMRIVMHCPKGTSIAAMQYLLSQPTIKTRHKCVQENTFKLATQNLMFYTKNYQHSRVNESKEGNRGWSKQRIQSNLCAIHKK